MGNKSESAANSASYDMKTAECTKVAGHGQLIVCACGVVHEDDGDTCLNCGTDLYYPARS